MLDLEARVHLHEEELAVGAHDEFDGSRAAIGDRARGGDRRFAHCGSHGVVEERRGRFLEHLLVAALYRALALEEVHAVAMRVAEHLELDVMRFLHVALEEHALVAERVLRFASGAFELVGEFALLRDDPHSLAAAARDRLDEQRIADLLRFGSEELVVLLFTVISGHDRDAGLLHDRLGAILEAHALDRLRRGPDEHEARILDGAREALVLREEPVAGMDRFSAARLRDLDDPLAAQIRLGGPGPADLVRLVGHLDVERMRVDR